MAPTFTVLAQTSPPDKAVGPFTMTITPSRAPAAGALLILSTFAAGTPAPNALSITGCNCTWQQEHPNRQPDGTDVYGSRASVGATRCNLAFRAMGTAPTSTPIVVTFDGAFADGEAILTEVTGVATGGTAGSGAVAHIEFINTTSNATTGLVRGARFVDPTNNVAFLSGHHGNSNAATPEAGYTLLADQHAGGLADNIVAYRPDGADVDASWTWTGSASWNGSLWEMVPAGGTRGGGLQCYPLHHGNNVANPLVTSSILPPTGLHIFECGWTKATSIATNPTLTGLGLTWTKAGEVALSATARYGVWYAVGAPSGAGTLSLSFGNNPTGIAHRIETIVGATSIRNIYVSPDLPATSTSIAASLAAYTSINNGVYAGFAIDAGASSGGGGTLHEGLTVGLPCTHQQAGFTYERDEGTGGTIAITSGWCHSNFYNGSGVRAPAIDWSAIPGTPGAVHGGVIAFELVTPLLTADNFTVLATTSPPDDSSAPYTITVTPSRAPAPDSLLLLSTFDAGTPTPHAISITGCNCQWQEEFPNRQPDGTDVYGMRASTGSTRAHRVFRGMGASPTAAPIVITFDGPFANAEAILTEITGVKTGGVAGSEAVAHREYLNTTANGTTGTVRGAQFVDPARNVAFLVGTHGSSSVSAPEAGYTMLAHSNGGNLSDNMQAYRLNGGDLDASWAWTGSASWSGALFEIVPAAGTRGGGFQCYPIHHGNNTAEPLVTSSILPPVGLHIFEAAWGRATAIATNPTLTGLGLTWTKAGEVAMSATARVGVWYAFGAPSGAGALTLTFGTAQTSMCHRITTFAGTAAIRNIYVSPNSPGTSTSITAALGAFASINSGSYACFAVDGGTGGVFDEGLPVGFPCTHQPGGMTYQRSEGATGLSLTSGWCCSNFAAPSIDWTASGALHGAVIAFELLSIEDLQVPPTITGQLSTTAPLATPAWVDLPNIVSASIRSSAPDPIDHTSPGTMSLTCESSQRELDPLNTAATLYPYLTPRRRLRLMVDHIILPAPIDLAHGWTDDWPPEWHDPSFGLVTVNAPDALTLLSSVPQPNSPLEIEILADTPKAYWGLGTGDFPGAAPDKSGNGYDGTYIGPVSHTTGLDRGDGAATFRLGAQADMPSASALVSFKSFGADSGITVEAMIRAEALDTPTHRWIYWQELAGGAFAVSLYIDPSGYPVFGWSINGGGIAKIGAQPVADGKVHHLMGKVFYTFIGDITSTWMWVDGVASFTAVVLAGSPVAHGVRVGSSLEYGYSLQGDLDEVATYQSALSDTRSSVHAAAALAPWDADTTGARLGRHLTAVGWPAADRDIDTGASVLGHATLAGQDTTSLGQAVASTEQGWFYAKPDGSIAFIGRYDQRTDARSTLSQATFTDDDAAGSTAYRFSEFEVEPANVNQVRNVIDVSSEESTVVTRDTASVTANTSRRVSISTLCRNAAECRALGQWVLTQYKDPRTFIRRITLDLAADRNLLVPILTLAIGDRVTIRRKPLNVGSAYTFDALIGAIDHDIGDGANRWRTTYSLVPVPTQGFWILGTSQLTSSDVLGY